MSLIKKNNEKQTAEITEISNEKKELNERIKDFEIEYLEVVKEKDEII